MADLEPGNEMNISGAKEFLEEQAGLFATGGVYALVDGQYGSTGKGLVAGVLAELFHDKVDMVLSNAGPNSGHTTYYKGRKIILKQLPTFGVIGSLAGMKQIPIGLTAGAVIDFNILDKEMREYGSNVFMHPHAAVLREEHKDIDADNVRRMASTGQGVGPAIISKLERRWDSVVQCKSLSARHPGARFNDDWAHGTKTIFMEVSQGFSLGINSGFYPYTTTRECTVSQAMADAGLPPIKFRAAIMVVRTFPIRVGDTDSSSGPCYSDQIETSWEDLGVKPETTTVTGRVRRVFTFSKQQFKDAVAANAPRVIFLNFMNYILHELAGSFIQENIVTPYREVTGANPVIMLGYGPKPTDIVICEIK